MPDECPPAAPTSTDTTLASSSALPVVPEMQRARTPFSWAPAAAAAAMVLGVVVVVVLPRMPLRAAALEKANIVFLGNFHPVPPRVDVNLGDAAGSVCPGGISPGCGQQVGDGGQAATSKCTSPSACTHACLAPHTPTPSIRASGWCEQKLGI